MVVVCCEVSAVAADIREITHPLAYPLGHTNGLVEKGGLGVVFPFGDAVFTARAT